MRGYPRDHLNLWFGGLGKGCFTPVASPRPREPSCPLWNPRAGAYPPLHPGPERRHPRKRGHGITSAKGDFALPWNP